MCQPQSHTPGSFQIRPSRPPTQLTADSPELGLGLVGGSLVGFRPSIPEHLGQEHPTRLGDPLLSCGKARPSLPWAEQGR